VLPVRQGSLRAPPIDRLKLLHSRKLNQNLEQIRVPDVSFRANRLDALPPVLRLAPVQQPRELRRLFPFDDFNLTP
jgi:hypothetical protein